MDWLEILVLSAALVSVLAFAALAVVLVRQGHAIRGLEEKVVRGGGAGEGSSPPLDRLRALQGQTAAPAPTDRQGGGGRRRVALVGGLGALVLALAAGGAWYLFVRDDDGAGPAPAQGAKPPPPPPRDDRVPASPPPLENKAAYTVAVLNGSGVDLAAANTGPRVQRAGYTVGAVGNAARSDVAVSMVMYPRGRQVVAQNVAKDLGIRRAPPVGRLAAGRYGGADAVVIVGRDIAGTP